MYIVQCDSESEHIYTPIIQTNSVEEKSEHWYQCARCGKIREDVCYVDEINCYFKLLHIYKKTYKSRGLYGRWCKGKYKLEEFVNNSSYFEYFSGHMNFNWEIKGLVPNSELQKRKFFEL